MKKRILAVSVVALAAACSSTHAVHLRHPLHVGQVDPNAVPFEARNEARERGLPPGVLVDEASIIEMTAERICLQTRLWSLEDSPERGLYDAYRIALLNDQDGVEQTQGELQPEQPTMTPMQGHIARTVAAGRRQVCSYWDRGRCRGYRWETIYRTYYEPHVWQVTSSPAMVCFPNQGFVTPSTTRVSLEFRPVGGAGSFVFQWLLDSAVQTTPGAPQPAQQQPVQQQPAQQPVQQQPVQQQPVQQQAVDPSQPPPPAQ
ncbi:MAG: hypothetical protein K8H88_32445 [Sandaracinaceae bacterium]|nr:hypothetical protein [Sandaracinaceae bacterium]